MATFGRRSGKENIIEVTLNREEKEGGVSTSGYIYNGTIYNTHGEKFIRCLGFICNDTIYNTPVWRINGEKFMRCFNLKFLFCFARPKPRHWCRLNDKKLTTA
jgi:hypothetical protein